MKFDCLETKKRYDCLAANGVLFLGSAIVSFLFFAYSFLSILALPFVVVGWIKEKYFDS